MRASLYVAGTISCLVLCLVACYAALIGLGWFVAELARACLTVVGLGG